MPILLENSDICTKWSLHATLLSIITPKHHFHYWLIWFIVDFDFDFRNVKVLIGEHHYVSFWH